VGGVNAQKREKKSWGDLKREGGGGSTPASYGMQSHETRSGGRWVQFKKKDTQMGHKKKENGGEGDEGLATKVQGKKPRN